MEPAENTLAGFARPGLKRLWETARRRLERNGVTITTSPLALDDLTDEEMAAICGLLARRRPPDNRIRVSLVALDDALRASHAQRGLLETLEAMSGPVRDRKAERAAGHHERAELWNAAFAHPSADIDGVATWLESVRRRGRLTRLTVDDPAAVLGRALDGVGWLHANGEAMLTEPLPLAVVAALQFGDAHAADAETALGSLLEDAVVALSGSADVRAAWRRFGVQLDNVSSSALTYMLPGAPGSVAGAARATAEPLRVTQRMFEHGFGLDVQPGSIVWVCENPSVLMLAADRLGDTCRPLVCLEGMPSAVTGHLLASVRSAGGELRVHSDFDFGGIAITSHVVARFGALPWRMGPADYVAALDGPTIPLQQRIGATPWDPELGSAMTHHRRAIHEEVLFPTLLADLHHRQ